MQDLWASSPRTLEDFRQIAFKALGYEYCWKQDLNDIPELREAIAHSLVKIDKAGFRYTLNKLVQPGARPQLPGSFFP